MSGPGLPTSLAALVAGLLCAAAVAVLLGPDPSRRLRVALARDRPALTGDPPGPGRPAGPGRSPGRRARAVRGGDRLAVPAAVLLDLVAEVLAGGAPVTRAVSAVGEALRGIDDPQAVALLALSARLAAGRPTSTRPPGVPAAGAPTPPQPTTGGGPAAPQVVDRLAEALDLAVATGSSPVPLLRAAAQQERRAAAARGVQAARRLGVLVVLPTGLCLLPAFLLLTVVPMAIGLALG